MSRKPMAEADHWWRILLKEIQTAKEDDGVFVRVVLQQGMTRGSLTIQAEVWQSHPDVGSRRTEVYSREFPHGDHNYLSGACWQAVMKVLELMDRSEAGEALRQPARGERKIKE